MPELDGFELAAMIREHPRFQKTAIIFISAIHLTDIDRLRGYEMGAVDYVPVPVIPEVLRAKVKIFAELYRKTRQLERLNAELEERVSARTAELEASTAQLRQSEESRSLALAAGNMGSWDWDRDTGECLWDDGQYGIFGVDRKHFARHGRERPRPDPSGGLAAAASSDRASPEGPQADPERIPGQAPERRDPLVHRHGRARASTAPARSRGSAASRSTSPSARSPRSGRRCWRARSTTAPRTRWRWCNRSCA